jgi:heme exporter protein D
MTQSFIWLFEGIGTIAVSILIVHALIKIMKYLE